MNPESYLRHVDGLRAVAVLSVLAYHLRVPHAGGGYVGVDVFFVISGYLITRLIVNELRRTGDFSFRRFYLRRIRRLFPALFTTLTLTTCAAYLLYSPQYFQNYGKELIATTLSFSNILFWIQSNYFAQASELKVLLHTWSLSVEEQFYLVWPALIVLATFRRRASRLWAMFVALGIASFIAIAPFARGNVGWLIGLLPWAADQLADGRTTVFYLTPFRVFEFSIGALVVGAGARLPTSRLMHEALMGSGIIMILLAVVLYTDRIFFPYFTALLPCIGAAMIIVATRAGIVGSLLTNRVAVGIGLISYSLYLVHWPIIVLYRYYKIIEFSGIERAWIALSSVALAWLMYFFVETRFRHPRAAGTQGATSDNRKFLTACASAAICACLLGGSAWAADGWAWRKPGALTPGMIEAGMQRRLIYVKDACRVVGIRDASACHSERPLQVLVLGNSHETDGYNAFYELYGSNPDVNLISFGTVNLCNIRFTPDGTPVSDTPAHQCDRRVAALADRKFLERLDVVVYSANIPFAKDKISDWQLL